MSVVVVTGSAGLIGSEASEFFASLGCDVVGVDNDMRRVYFGEDASTNWNRNRLECVLGRRYTHVELDIRDGDGVRRLFQHFAGAVELVVHTAAQPSHDWAATDPPTDFGVNAVGTSNLLEATRAHSPDAVFIYTSTNKVYGDTPNRLPLLETASRWEIDPTHTYAAGIREDMSIDQSLHSLFGVSKAAADMLVQEYGRYFGMKTACFRGGCLTGPRHSGTQLHGFLAYLMKCAATGTQYTVCGYGGKQVRDNIHSADLISAFYEFFKAPRIAEVYNIGGGRFSNCSMIEAIEICGEIVGAPMQWDYSDASRIGDHKWWITDVGRFAAHYAGWQLRRNIRDILQEIYEANIDRWARHGHKASATSM